MDTQLFEVHSTRHNDGWILTVSGELDMATVPCIREVLDSWFIVPNHLIVDASGLSFIDSSGLRVLLYARELVGGRLLLRRPSEQTLRVLELSGLADIIEIEMAGDLTGPDNVIPKRGPRTKANEGSERSAFS